MEKKSGPHQRRYRRGIPPAREGAPRKGAPPRLPPLARQRVIPQPWLPSQQEPPQAQQRQQRRAPPRQQPSPLHPEEECEISSRRTRTWRTRRPTRRSRRYTRRIQKRARLKELTWEARLYAHPLHIARKKIEMYRTKIENACGYCADGDPPL